MNPSHTFSTLLNIVARMHYDLKVFPPQRRYKSSGLKNREKIFSEDWSFVVYSLERALPVLPF